jgi:hypothetical protein
VRRQRERHRVENEMSRMSSGECGGEKVRVREEKEEFRVGEGTGQQEQQE